MAISFFTDLMIKWQAAAHILRAGKVVPIERLTLREMTLEPQRYAALAEGLTQLPLPQYFKLGRKRLPIPADADAFSKSITYGQKLFFMQDEGFDLGIILRYVAGYYYTFATGQPWNEANALKFGKKVLALRVVELYPVAQHLVNLMAELITTERKLLHREPTQQERAAGVERLNKFADLSNVIFLMEQFKCDEAAVMLKPYPDCLVRFMMQREQVAYNERLTEVYRKEQQTKAKR